MRTARLTAILPLLALLTLGGCGQPDNPYDSLKQDETVTGDDKYTIQYLHKNIFSVNCATGGCHDGHFEPDFRTIQSSYNSLVYQPVIKNTTPASFTYRVLPGDVSNSWLHERLVTDDQVLGRMPLYSPAISPDQLDAIDGWIQRGAKDAEGNAPVYPDQLPRVNGIASYQTISGFTTRTDTVRNGVSTNPFGVMYGYNAELWLDVTDAETPVQNLQNLEVKFSTVPDNFSTAKTFALEYQATPKTVPNFYGPGKTGTFYLKAIVDTRQLAINTVNFMRVYVKDPAHTDRLEFPNNGSPINTMSSWGIYNYKP